LKLKGKTAFITGGGSGIGLETARLFVGEGASVMIVGRDADKIARAAAELGGDAIGAVADVTRPDALAAAMSGAEKRLGRIDILFANAGISETPPFRETTEESYDAIMDINVKGLVFTVVKALPLLQDGASIVLTGSVAARKGWPGDPIYAASKGAVRSFGRTLAVEEEILSRKIRVNVVTPGATRTPLTRAATDDPAVSRHVSDLVPMKRWGEAREVAEVVLFLASDASSYVTGAETTVDGGLAHA
jgi:NAD(P)-dependent dehydrogenase (short-subunit alcohol dehydrogenase family)